MADELLEGEAHIPGVGIMTSREWAADLLQSVAEATGWGGYPQGVSAFDLGRALGRALTNSNQSEDLGDLMSEICAGAKHYESRKRG